MVQPNEITTFQGIHDIARSRGEMDIGHAIDYIVVDRRFPWNCIPDLVIGRVVYDNWLVGHAILEGQVVVVEATETLLAVHQLGKDLVRRIHVTNQALSVTCAPWKTLNGPDGRINMKKVKMHKGCGQLVGAGVFLSRFFAKYEAFIGTANASVVPTHSIIPVEGDVANEIEQAALSIFHKENLVMVTLVNEAFLPFVNSWMCNTEPLEIHHKLLFLTTDAETKQKLLGRWPEVKVVALALPDLRGKQSYHDVGYMRLMIQRLHIVVSLLEAGLSLFMFEVDCVWLSNPLPILLARQTDGDLVTARFSSS
nr:hypothetical protein BaRGS_003548 [Batillaria attramentaria]KAG5701083.1 hypothetical protein BaRGS_008804 [Batillaria attramentaria]